MSDTTESLRRKIASADALKSVVHTMKALAVSNMGQYENAVRALDEYYRTVQLGLLIYFKHNQEVAPNEYTKKVVDTAHISAVIFGSDQGLVGQFNEVIAHYAAEKLTAITGKKTIMAVGERLETHLIEAKLIPLQLFNVPNIISLITPLVGQILIELETQREKNGTTEIYLFYNRTESVANYKPVQQRLLPLDKTWLDELNTLAWSSKNLPEIVGDDATSLSATLREYLFVSLFRACAESLASENASRLAAMQRAEKNIAELRESLTRIFHQLRQDAIDEELFDVIAGFEALGSNSSQ